MLSVIATVCPRPFASKWVAAPSASVITVVRPSASKALSVVTLVIAVVGAPAW